MDNSRIFANVVSIVKIILPQLDDSPFPPLCYYVADNGGVVT